MLSSADVYMKRRYIVQRLIKALVLNTRFVRACEIS